MWQSEIQKLQALSDPISSAALPLLNGLARRNLARSGVAQREVHIGGVNVNYYHKAPIAQTPSANMPILLLHGLGDSAITWSSIIAPLARDHAVYAVDLPGYGLSSLPAGCSFSTLEQMRDVLVAFLRDVIGQPALVVGNSLGGWLAVKLAWATPALVRGIMLLDAGGAPLEGRASWEPFLEAIAVRDLKTARLVFRQMFGAIPPPLLYLGQRGLQELFQRQVIREFVAAVQEDEFIHPDELRQLPVPAAIIWGLSDRFLPTGSLEFFREHLPNAELLLLKHCGHLPQRERPRATARFIRSFVARLAASAEQATAGPATTEPAEAHAPNYTRTDWSQSRNTATTLGSQ
jgi:pimeloyl-ACP methyl ester carboxylesterase